MKKTNSPIGIKFSVIVWCILAVLVWAAPCSALFVYPWDPPLEIYDMSYAGQSIVVYGGILNLHPGAVVNFIDVWEGSIVNIHGGTICYGLQVGPSTDPEIPNPIVTVYGSGFAVNGTACVGENGEPLSEIVFDLPYGYGFGELTGTYENGQPVNGDPTNGLAFYLYDGVPLHLAVSAPEVIIDIKPGSDTNPINLKSKGVVPVAVLTTDEFEAAEVDPATVHFAGAAPLQWSLEDVDGDGDEDMLFHFKTDLLNLDVNSTEATLTGETKDRIAFQATDVVQIVPSKK